MEGSVILNCRNFKCGLNKSGQCASERITLTPQGNLIDHVLCIDACEHKVIQPETDSEGGSK